LSPTHSAHNPTGSDPTIDQWKKILTVIQQKKHVAFFDSAYQGFASGDAEEDAQPFRYAVSQQVPILLAQSKFPDNPPPSSQPSSCLTLMYVLTCCAGFAKNFGLYGERCGTLSVVCGDQEQKDHILSELRAIIRPMYSSPPCHGSSIVKTVLKSDFLRPQYYQECAQMSARIQKMRGRLLEELAKAGSQHDWSHVLKQIGMFAFTGLTVEMSLQLTSEYAVFLTTNGRISIAGLNESNVEYVAKCIHEVTDGKSITGEA
jgi:aspartate aminotransferase